MIASTIPIHTAVVPKSALVLALGLSIGLALPVAAFAQQPTEQAAEPAQPTPPQPTPPQPSASAPPAPSAPTIDWDADTEARWIEVMPVLLWWAGENEPRYQVCTEAELTGVQLRDCPISDAPETVRSVNLRCDGFDCQTLPTRQRVKVFGKVIDGLFVAGKKEE